MLRRFLLLSLLFFAVVLHATPPSKVTVTKLYVATLDRAPDAAGLDFWVNESGFTLEQIAMSFFDQKETQKKYPKGTPHREFIKAVYENLFYRAPDNQGWDYWEQALESQQLSLSVFVLAVVNGALGDDAKIIANKTTVALSFALAGRSDINEASSIITDITKDSQSVTQAMEEYGLSDKVVTPIEKEQIASNSLIDIVQTETPDQSTSQEKSSVKDIPQGIILKESFENLRANKGWHVERGNVTGDHGIVWDTHNNGLEVERGIVSATIDGDVHAELDAHHNVTISTQVNLKSGSNYELSFSIKPRGKYNKSTQKDTSAMEISLSDNVLSIESDKDGLLSTNFDNTNMSIITTSQDSGWTEVTITYTNITQDSNTLTIKGTGADDSYGMLLDAIELRGDDSTVTPTNTILKESFENLRANKGWDIQQGNVTGDHGIVWDTHNNGLEVERGIVSDSADGDVHAELDAHNNVTISTQVDLKSGSNYELSFSIKPRGKNNKSDQKDTSAMEISLGDNVVSIESDKDGLLSTNYDDSKMSLNTQLQNDGWTRVTINYTNITQGSHTLTIKGTGASDSYGMLLDAIELRGESTDEDEEEKSDTQLSDVTDEAVSSKLQSVVSELTLIKIEIGDVESYDGDRLREEYDRVKKRFDDVKTLLDDVKQAIDNSTLDKVALKKEADDIKRAVDDLKSLIDGYKESGDNSEEAVEDIRSRIDGVIGLLNGTNKKHPLATEITNDTLTVIETNSNLNGLTLTKMDDSIDVNKIEVYKLDEKSLLSIPEHVTNLSDIFQFNNIENKKSMIEIPVNVNNKEELIEVRLYRYNKENDFWDTTVMDTDFDENKLSIKINLSLVNNIPFFIGVVSMKNMGAIQASNDVLQLIPLATTPASLRTRDITDLPSFYDLSSKMPPVRSQGSQGSCASWATGYYLKGYQEHVEHKTTYGTGNNYEGVFSPAFLYNSVNGGQDRGSSFPDNLNRIQNIGISPWTDMPYRDNDYTRLPSQEALDNAVCRKISSYQRLFNKNDLVDSDLTNIKYYLSKNYPVLIAISVYGGFDSPSYINREFIYNQEDFTKKRGGHAIVIVGYDNTKRAFKIVNSWGTGWGNDGYLWITYDILKQIIWSYSVYISTDTIINCNGEINLPTISIDEVMPYSGFAKTTDFKFRAILSEVLPEGYSVYLNFDNLNGEWLKESDAGGHLKMNCEGQICTSNTSTNVAGIRSVRAGIFKDDSLDVISNYSEPEGFEVKEEQVQANILTFTTNPTSFEKGEIFVLRATTNIPVDQVRFQFGIEGWINASRTNGGTTWIFAKQGGIQSSTNAYADINNDGVVDKSIVINIEETPTIPSLKTLYLSSYSMNSGDSFTAYCDFNGDLPSGYKVKIGDSSSNTPIFMKGGQEQWNQGLTSSTISGNYKVYFNLYNDTTFVKNLGSVSYTVNATIEPLTPPQNVKATDGDYTNNIKITWDSVANATKYYIYRAVGTETSSYSQIGSTTDTYTFDTSVDVKNRYFYKVKAYNSSTGMSEESDWNKGYTKLETPTNVTASDGSYDDRVRVSWNSVANANRYYIYRSTSSGGTYSYLKNTTATYYDDTSANSGTTYYYKVTAENTDISRATSDYSSYNSGYAEDVAELNCNFTDIDINNNDQWWAGYVMTLCEAGIVNGYPTASGDPEYKATQYANWVEVISVINQSSNFSQTETECSGNSNENWYDCHIDIAEQKGFANIGPNSQVTRGLAFRYAVKSFWPDSKENLTESEAVQVLMHYNIISNDDREKNMNRAELAAIAVKIAEERDITLGE